MNMFPFRRDPNVLPIGVRKRAVKPIETPFTV